MRAGLDAGDKVALANGPPADDTTPLERSSVEESIHVVLDAERQARTAVQNCRTRAQRETLRARTRSHRIQQRGERRLALIRHRARTSVAHQLAELEREATTYATPPQLDPRELAAARQVAHTLAAQMTGGGQDTDGEATRADNR